MDLDTFWGLIDAHVEVDDDLEVHVEGLIEALSQERTEAIADFGRHFDALMASSYRADLWGAAHLVKGGCSDDAFDAFRAWLIAMGRTAFENAMEDPDSLGELALADAYCESEEMLSVADRAHMSVAGEPLELGPAPLQLQGELWDFDDEAESKRRHPRIHAMFDQAEARDWQTFCVEQKDLFEQAGLPPHDASMRPALLTFFAEGRHPNAPKLQVCKLSDDQRRALRELAVRYVVEFVEAEMALFDPRTNQAVQEEALRRIADELFPEGPEDDD